MKKIRKIDTARRIYELDGNCDSVGDFGCKDCFYCDGKIGVCEDGDEPEIKASALAYILQYSRKPEEVARLRKENPLKDEVQAIQKKITTAEPKPVSAKTAPTRDTEREFWEFVKNGDPYPDHCAGQQSRGYCDDRCPYNDENGLCPYEHETKSRMNEYAENFFKKDTRPNFRQALKDKNEFYVKVTPELSKELRKIERKITKFWEWVLDRKYLIYEFVSAGGLGTSLNMSVSFSNKKPNLPEYLPATDTFKEPIHEPKVNYHSKFDAMDSYEDEADELPECIKFTDPVPKFCYHITQKAIKWNRCKFVTEKTSEGETSYILLEHGGKRSFGDETYKSLDDAVRVLKSKEVTE